MSLEYIVEQLKDECNSIDLAIAALEGTNRSLNGSSVRGFNRHGRKRRLSAAARQRISEVAKSRWAAAKKAGRNRL
jgi:hypothetical protein